MSRWLLVVGIWFGLVAEAQAIDFIQSASDYSAGGSGLQTLAVAFPAAVKSGNTIVVAVAGDITPSGDFSLEWCSVADSLGVTYAPGLGVGLGGKSVLVYAQSVATSGANTVTLTCTTGPTSSNLRMAVHEYSGVATTVVVDQYVLNIDPVGSSATDGVTSTAKTTTRAGDLIFGATYIDTASTVTAGTGFTARETLDRAPVGLVTEDVVQSSQGSVAATFTSSAVKPCRTVMAALFDPKPYLRGGALLVIGGKLGLK